MDQWYNPSSGNALKEISKIYKQTMNIPEDVTLFLEFSSLITEPKLIKVRAVGYKGKLAVAFLQLNGVFQFPVINLEKVINDGLKDTGFTLYQIEPQDRVNSAVTALNKISRLYGTKA